MNRKTLSIMALSFACWFSPKSALAVTCNVAHVFVTGETITAVNLNANPSNEVNCINNVDFNNVGTAGIYASQIKPGNSSQATFGGVQNYTFPAGVTAGSLTANTASFTGTANSITMGHDAVNSQSGVIAFQNGSGSFGILAKDSPNELVFYYNGTPQMTMTNAGAVTMQAGLSATTGTFSGAITGSGYSGGPLSGTTGTFSGAVSMTALTATTGTFSGAVTGSGYSGGAVSGTTGSFSGAVTGASYSGGPISGTTGTFSGAATSPTIATFYGNGSQQTSNPHVESFPGVNVGAGSVVTKNFGTSFSGMPTCNLTIHSAASQYPPYLASVSTTQVGIGNSDSGAAFIDATCVGQ